jgi:hypothetical protein
MNLEELRRRTQRLTAAYVDGENNNDGEWYTHRVAHLLHTHITSDSICIKCIVRMRL